MGEMVGEENLSIRIRDRKKGVLKVRRFVPGNIPMVMISGRYLREIDVDIGDYVLVSVTEENNRKYIRIEKAKVTITAED